MQHDPGKTNLRYRRSMRLPGYDYAWAGWYAVTICTHHRLPLFGAIHDGEMRLSPFGVIVEDEWLRTQQIRREVRLDAFVIMPNHFHGIVVIEEFEGDAEVRLSSEPTPFNSPSRT